MPTQTPDLTWQDAYKFCLALIRDGTPEQQTQARMMLERMAFVADNAVGLANAARTCLLRDDIANDELGELLRAVVAVADTVRLVP